MAIYTLAQLKDFSNTLYKHSQHEYQNQAYRDLAQKEKQKVLDKTDGAVKKIDAELDRIFYSKGAPIFHIVSIVMAVVLFIGCFTFLRPAISFDFDDVVEAYDEKAKEKPSIIPNAIVHHFEGAYGDGEGGYLAEPNPGEHLDEYEKWRTEECTILVGGCMFLAALLIGAFAFFASYISEKRTRNWKGIIITLGVTAGLCALCWIIFVCKGAWGDVTGLFSFIGSVLNVILMLVISPFGALVFVFRAGYVMFLAAILAPLSLFLGYVAYSLGYAVFLANNDGLSSSSEEATKLVAKKKSIIANCPKEAESMYNKILAKITPNPYEKAKSLIPCDLQKDLGDLIYALENGYAHDYIEARQYVQQQKNHKALLEQRERQHKEQQRQLSDLRNSVDRQTQAIRDAANKEVDVYIHY